MLIITRRSLALFVLLVGLLLVAAPARGQEDATPNATPPVSTFLERLAAGEEWPEVVYATDVAFGDVDGDGRDEVAIVTSANTGARVVLLDDCLLYTSRCV